MCEDAFERYSSMYVHMYVHVRTYTYAYYVCMHVLIYIRFSSFTADTMNPDGLVTNAL